MSVIDCLVREWPYLEIQSMVGQKEYSTRYLVRNRSNHRQQYYVDILTFPVSSETSQFTSDSDGTTILMPETDGTMVLMPETDGTVVLMPETNGSNTNANNNQDRDAVEKCIKNIETIKKLSEDDRNFLLRIYEYRQAQSEEQKELYIMILLEALPSIAMMYSQEKYFDLALIKQMGTNICWALDNVGMKTIPQTTITPEDIYVVLPQKLKLGSYIYSTDAIRVQSLGQSNSRRILYQSPEEIRHQGADQRSLVYSVGMIMYEMGNGGYLPGSTQKTAQMSLMDIEQNVNQRISGASVKIPSLVNPDMGSNIVKAISLNPIDRFPSLQSCYGAFIQNSNSQVVKPQIVSNLQSASTQNRQAAPMQNSQAVPSSNKEMNAQSSPMSNPEPRESRNNQVNTGDKKTDIPRGDSIKPADTKNKKSPLVPILAVMCALMTTAAVFITMMVLRQQYKEKYVVPFEKAEAEKKAEQRAEEAKQKEKEAFYNNAVYVADVYNQLALREKAYISAPVTEYLKAGTKLQIIGDGEGPMAEVLTEDGKYGFVEKKYLVAEGMKTFRMGTKKPHLAEDNIYLIDRYDSAPVYSGPDESYSTIGFLPAGNPIQILEWGEYFAQMIDLQSGMIGYVPIGDVPINTQENLQIFMTADIFTTPGFYNKASYPVNSDEIIYLRKDETIYSEAVDILKPGEWVTLLSISDDGKMCNVMTQKEKPVSGYIPTELLYADPEEGTE